MNLIFISDKSTKEYFRASLTGRTKFAKMGLGVFYTNCPPPMERIRYFDHYNSVISWNIVDNKSVYPQLIKIKL